MKRILFVRLVLMIIGLTVWAHGYRANSADVRLVGIGILAIALLAKFVPRRWLDGDAPR